MADSPLARLHAWSTDHACAVIAIADEDSFEDPAAAALLRFALGDVDDLGSKPELVLVATPERLQLHCSASALSGVRALLGATAAPLPVDVFSPSPQLGPESDAAVDFKPEAEVGAPLHWQVHSVSVALMGLPRVGEPDTVEGALRYEDSFVLDGRGGSELLTALVPRLCAWPATQAEASEIRSVEGALHSTGVCPAPFRVVDRLRAGEHHVLQVMCAAPLEGEALLLGSPWLPVVRGEVRLYASGLSFSSPRHGPLVLPFRIHLAAVATYRLNCHDGRGLLLFRQHPDEHAYGPLALLPARLGAAQPDADAPAPSAMSLALVVRAGSDLQHAIQQSVWPLWTQLFRELGIPCDDLAAAPAEIRDALAQHQREEPPAA